MQDAKMQAACSRPKQTRKTSGRRRESVAQAIFTIGYQERSAVEFIKALRFAKVSIVVDVRAVPLSRRADFRKNALASLLDDAGIKYIGMSGLGTPRELRDRLKADRDYPSFFTDFRKHMMTRRTDLKALIDIASSANAALLCFERDAATCHRSVVASYVSNKLGCTTVDL